MSDYPDDFRLLEECIRGKKEAWDTFVTRFSRLVYYSINKTLKLHTHNPPQEDVDDVFNGIFLSFIENDYKKLRQFEGKQGCTLSSWIRLISIRHTIDFLRGQKRQISLDDDSNDTRPMVDTLQDNRASVDEIIELSETEKMMKEAIDELPSSDRLFIRLQYEKDLPPEEIAIIINASVNTVYSKKNRIRQKIKKIIRDKEVIARNTE